MKVHHSASSYNSDTFGVITIGTFDGVHVGHKKIIQHLVDSSEEETLQSVILTFFPHPRMVLQKENDIRLINTIDERITLLENAGLDQLIIHPFTYAFSRLTAQEFVRDILVDKLKAKKVIIGYDHRFGRNRDATIEDLKAYGRIFDFEVIEIDAQQLDEVSISSTKIRKALDEGAIETANRYLGYFFMLSGEVIHGKAFGRTIGFPTANIEVAESYKLIPKNGVYVVKAIINETIVFGMTNVGPNRTVGGEERRIETHFLDFEADLYGKNIQIEFLTRIRDGRKFDSEVQLKEAIQKDEVFTRDYIKNYE